MSTPQWEQSVEKARLALVKTFEGRIEAALASFEQVPPGSGGSKTRGQKLAQFASEAGIQYAAIEEYRAVTKWLSSNPVGAGFEDALRVVRGIRAYSVAKEAMRSKKWRTGKLFAEFVLNNHPPEGNAHWTVDALREHLGRPTSHAGTVAKALAAGGKVGEDDLHAAVALDAVETASEEIEGIGNTLAQAETALTGIRILGEHITRIPSVIDSTTGFAPNITDEVRKLVEKLAEVKLFLDLHGSEKVPDPDGGEDETRAELMLDALQAHKGEIDLAFAEVGVGASFDSLLSQ